jgi:hypothetical protein
VQQHLTSLRTFVGLWWATLLGSYVLIEPLGWFDGGPQELLESLGVWGYFGLLLAPLPIVGARLEWGRRRARQGGVREVSSGQGREQDFQSIRRRAKRRIVIVGIGMSNLAGYARSSLAAQAATVDIDLFMLDPQYLRGNPEFATELGRFLGIEQFTTRAEHAYEALHEFCAQWNGDPSHDHSIRLWTYRGVPTHSMVMIDPDEPNGEAVVEFFLVRSGEHRPRMRVARTGDPDDLFAILESKLREMRADARRVT